MNLVPDMIIIDFCEWLKRSVLHNQKEYSLFDLVVDERYSISLVKYAEDFLNDYKPSLRRVLHSFVDSEYFDDCLQEYNVNVSHHAEKFDELYRYGFCYFCNETRLDNNFRKFIKAKYLECNKYFNRQITPQALVDSVSFLFENASNNEWIQHNKKWIMEYLHSFDSGLDLEIDFLEWLISENNDPMDFRKMPLKYFECLAEKFRFETNRSPEDVKKLIKSFKQSDITTLSKKIMAVMPLKRIKRAKDLGYIIDRYHNKSIPYKCFIVPRKSNAVDYEEFIEKRWDDLHHLSGDYLDIYYAETDYGRSGYEIMHQMNYIPDHLRKKAPSIIIWENNMSKAQGVDINRLDNNDLFDIVECIVNCIRDNKSFDEIIKEANTMSDKLREGHRTVTNNTVSISGSTITGNIAAENNGVMHTTVFQSNDTTTLLNEFETAIQIIQEFTEINDHQKNRLNSIIKESIEAINTNSEEKKEDSKKSFKDALLFMGNIGSKLVAAFSGLVNVLKFFGVSPVKPL